MEEALKNEDCNGQRNITPNLTSVDEDGGEMMSQRTHIDKMHQTISLIDKNITMVGNIILKNTNK
jgi:hypothetical protein